MNEKLLLVVVILTALALTGSALALAPMGPPTTGLKTGQFRAGVEYSYSDMDLKGSWSDEAADILDEWGLDGSSGTFKGIKSNMIFGNFGYGIMDEWEAFARLGVACVKKDDWDFSSAYGFAWGFGTKVTFLKQENLNWGALFQMTWTSVDDAAILSDIELDYYEMQIAVGPTWKLNDTLSIYGGPFVHFIDGEINVEGDHFADLEEDSAFGGYIGADAALADNISLFGEFQLTGDGWAIGTGINWKF